MHILPLSFNFDDSFLGEKKERITGEIFERELGRVGVFELYIIKGDDELKGYVDQYRGDPFSNWYPMNIFHDIEYDYDSCQIDGKIAYLDSIVVDEKYQNNGIGTIVIDKIITHLKKENINILILQPSPILIPNAISINEDEENKEKRLRLTKFYQTKFEFQKVTTQNILSYPIYYLKLN
jgi:ribosomal protein S18 acetylase RimI-like enzyme